MDQGRPPVRVHVPGKDQVHLVLIEQVLKGLPALYGIAELHGYSESNSAISWATGAASPHEAQRTNPQARCDSPAGCAVPPAHCILAHLPQVVANDSVGLVGVNHIPAGKGRENNPTS